MNIGATIKDFRKRKKMTQTEFANIIGITQASLSQIETNTIFPSKSTIKKISNALDVPEQFIYLLSIREEDLKNEKRERYKILYPTLREIIHAIVI